MVAMSALIFTAADIAELRADVRDYLPDTYTLVRKGAGGTVAVAVRPGDNICRLAAATGGPSSNTMLLGERFSETVPYTIDFLYGADVRRADVLTIATRQFEVIGVEQTGAWGVNTIAYCTERR